MLFPEKMLRVKIEIEPGYSNEVIEQIGKIGTLHIDKSKTLLSNEAEASRVKILWSLVQKTMGQLEVETKRKETFSIVDIDMLLDHAEKTLGMIGLTLDYLLRKQKEMKDESKHFERAMAVKKAFEKVLDIEKLSVDLQMIKIRLGIVDIETVEFLRLSLKEKEILVLDQFLFEETSAVAVLCASEEEEDVSSAFVTLKVQELSLKYFSEQSFIVKKQEEAQVMLDKKKMFEEYKEELQSIESQLYTLNMLEKAKSSLRELEHGKVLEGWIPKSVSKTFAKMIKHAVVTFSLVEGDAPVLIHTPYALKPFEKLITNFSYPRYGEVNPVLPFAITFLLLFGIMFGDIGHGLVLASLGLWVRKKSSEYADLGQIYYLSGLSAAFFGFLYGSVFGVHTLFPCLLFNPIENINATIIFSIVIGISIISLSFFLHIVTALKRKELSLLFVGEGSLLWLLAYWFSIGIFVKSVVQKMDITYELIFLALLLVIIFIQMLINKVHKIQAIIDLLRKFMETITNTISFLRVGAFALAHGALFMAVFSMARMISENYGEGFFYWMLIIVGNVVIIVLEGVIVTIQTLRLEYYEFFKRFFKGGGSPYHPYNLNSKE